MLCRLAVSTIILCGMTIGHAGAGETDTRLQPGAYEVEVRLEIPNVINWAAVKTARVCVSDGRDANGPPLQVLSDNNPFADCPAKNVRREGRSLRFQIVCEGLNMAKARASYTLAQDRFDGRIAMVMGGKNMTMTEVQAGRRVGACDPAAVSPN